MWHSANVNVITTVVVVVAVSDSLNILSVYYY